MFCLLNKKRVSSLNNDIDLKELEIGRLKKKVSDNDNENNLLLANNEKLK